MKQKRAFSSEEISFMLANYKLLGPDKIAKKFNRLMKNVSRKAAELGITQGPGAGNIRRAIKWNFSEWTYDLGYICGVYLGDGSIRVTEKNGAYFRLTVIDKDFCENTAIKLKSVTGIDSTINFYGNKWTLTFGNRDFSNWLFDIFGGPNFKQIWFPPSIEASKGIIEGIFDSEGTVIKTTTNSGSFLIRMNGNLEPVQRTFQILGVKHRSNHRGISNEIWQGPNFHGYSISNKEYTRLGFGTYIKRKAINGLVYKGV